jgi:signal transduction histidine kinase
VNRSQAAFHPRPRLGRLADGVVPIALAALGIAEVWSDVPPGRAAKQLAVLGALTVSLPLLWRRSAPLLVLAAVLTGFGVVWATERHTGGVAFAGVVAMLLALYSVGAHAAPGRGRPAALTALGLLALFLGVDSAAGDLRITDALGSFVFFPMAWLLGDLLRGKQLQLISLEQRAGDLERERDQRAEAAVAAERARIARELHDVLAHTTSVIVLDSGAARQVLRSSPDTAEELLLSIERIGRDALAELRRLLGLLRDAHETDLLAPQPGLARLPTLIEELNLSGVSVDLHVEGEPAALSPGLDLAAYRITQEALTNVVRHARTAHATVTIRYRPTELELIVANDSTGAQSRSPWSDPGRGLIGMRERAVLYGGRFIAAPLPDGGYQVQACLPLQGAP